MKELEIVLRIRDDQAKQAVKAQVDGMAKLEAATRRAGDAQDKMAQRALLAAQKGLAASRKAADEAAAAGIKAAQREAEARDKMAQRAAAASRKAAAAIAKAFHDASAAQVKAEAKALDAAVKAANQKAAASSKAAQAGIAAAQKRVDAETRAARKVVDVEAARVAKLDILGRQQLSREEVQLRARAQANQKYQQSRVDASARAMAGEKESGSAIDKAIAGVGNLAAAYAGFSVVESVFRGIAGAISESRDKAAEFATSLLSTKDQLAEIATLRGLAFADDGFVKKMAGFSQATGLTIGQSDQFQRQLFGSAAGALQKGNVDEDTLDKAAVMTGRTAVRQTKDFGTRGDLVGMLGQFRKYDRGDAGAKQIAQDAEAVRLALTEGRGDDAPLTKSFLNVAGSMIGEGRALPSAPELAALIGTTSLTAGAGMADTRSEQLMRGLRGGTPEQMGFLKNFAGIGENDTLETRLDKIVPKLRANRPRVGT